MKMNVAISFPKWVVPLAWIAAPIIAAISAFILVIRVYLKVLLRED